MKKIIKKYCQPGLYGRLHKFYHSDTNFRHFFFQLLEGVIRFFSFIFLPLVRPIEGAAHRKYFPNNRITITLNVACNIRCSNCYVIDKEDEEMSLGQIEAFVKEALELGYHWDVVELRGGETTLHSRFFDVLEIIKRYKDANPDCRIVVLTNGVGVKVNEIISKIPQWVEVWNAKKDERKDVYLGFWVFTIAPIDSFQYNYFTDFSKGCRLISECYGLCLSKYGYYPCSPCVEVDKIFGFDVGIKKLLQVNEAMLRSQMKILCQYCGFFREPPRIAKKEKISKSWTKACEQHRKHKPRLTAY